MGPAGRGADVTGPGGLAREKKMSVQEAEALEGAVGHEKFRRLIARAQQQPPVVTALAHPCDEAALESAVEANRLKLITPILVGPRAKIQEAAKASNLDIGAFELVDALHSHDAAAKAVALVREGRAEILM